MPLPSCFAFASGLIAVAASCKYFTNQQKAQKFRCAKEKPNEKRDKK
jgi:hypothetical protein